MLRVLQPNRLLANTTASTASSAQRSRPRHMMSTCIASAKTPTLATIHSGLLSASAGAIDFESEH
eukprot:15450982-Alexandrium_andersonii.AAC.1